MAITFTYTASGTTTSATFTLAHATEGSTSWAKKALEFPATDGKQLMDMGTRSKFITVTFRLESETAQSTFDLMETQQGILLTENKRYPSTVCEGVTWGVRNGVASGLITVEGTATFECLDPAGILYV